MKKIILITALLCGLLVTAQNTTQERKVSAFTKLDVAGFYEVVLVKDKGNTLTITGPKDVVSLITTNVSGNTLKISMENSTAVKSHTTVTITIPVSTLESAHITGSGSIACKEALDTDIETKVVGSGSIALHIKSSNAQAFVTGSGSIKLEGTVQNYTCNINGSGSLKTDGLQAANVTVEVNGSGTAYVYSSKEISGKVVGSGTVYYSGNPTTNSVKVTGSGSISKK